MKQTIITTYKKIYAGHTDLIMCFVLIILVLFSSALPAQATPECQRLRSQAACISKFSNPPVHVNGAQMPRGNASWLVMVFQSVGWLSVFASHFLYGLANRGCSHASFNEWLLHFPASQQRRQQRLLLVGGSEQHEQWLQPELQLGQREPAEQQHSYLWVRGSGCLRIYRLACGRVDEKVSYHHLLSSITPQSMKSIERYICSLL